MTVKYHPIALCARRDYSEWIACLEKMSRNLDVMRQCESTRALHSHGSQVRVLVIDRGRIANGVEYFSSFGFAKTVYRYGLGLRAVF